MVTAIAEPPVMASPTPTRWGAQARIDSVVRFGAGLLLWSGLLVITYWWEADGGVRDLVHAATGLTSLGRLTGLWAAQLLLVQVLLMSRLPPLEHAFGRDRLVRTHRIVGFTSFYLLLAHIITIIGGYASARWSLVLPTTWQLITEYGGVLIASAGTVALIMVVVTSIRAARRRMRYESWHLVHLYGYLGAGLALPHQLWTGQEFLRSDAATVYWWSLWIAAAAAVIMWRLALPLWRSLRFRLRVAGVLSETADTVSLILTGRSLHRLPLQAGQFLNVRILARPGWTRANPFSVSAAPDGSSVRITAKAVGDGSSRLASVQPGTRVMFEGPYGRLSPRARRGRRIVLAGAGVASHRCARWPKLWTMRPERWRCSTATPESRSSQPNSTGWPSSAACGSCRCRAVGRRPGRSSAQPLMELTRPAPCSTGCLILPIATSTSADRRPGRRASRGSWPLRACRGIVFTTRVLVGDL